MYTGRIYTRTCSSTWLPEVFLINFFTFCSFLGISIIADIFMCAIEKITSKTRKIHIATGEDGQPDVIEVPVWNGTVANLTLMALGK